MDSAVKGCLVSTDRTVASTISPPLFFSRNDPIRRPAMKGVHGFACPFVGTVSCRRRPPGRNRWSSSSNARDHDAGFVTEPSFVVTAGSIATTMRLRCGAVCILGLGVEPLALPKRLVIFQ